MTAQTSTIPFMNIREGGSRKISFDTRDELGGKIDKLTVMLGRLAAKDSSERRSFKPQVYQSRGRGQNRGYSQRSYQIRNRLGNMSKVGMEDSLGKIEVDPDLSKVIEGTILEAILEDTVDKIVEGNIEMIIIGVVVIIEVGIGLERDHSHETIAVTELEVQATVDQGQDQEPVLIGIG